MRRLIHEAEGDIYGRCGCYRDLIAKEDEELTRGIVPILDPS
jgi:hypothetical protein